MQDILLEVHNLVKYFPIKRGHLTKRVEFVRAVDNVSFTINRGETFGLAGESGCGKTTVGRTILNLIKPTAGEVVFEGKNIFKLGKEELRMLRKDMQMVYQDPVGALDPRQMVFDIIAEPLKTHTNIKRKELERRVLELLELVGLSSDHIRRYPHEFSGGQRQRIVIARALALTPKFIVLDEPTASLDVSVQATILNLLREIQFKFKLTYLFISHNLSVMHHMCTRLAIMYLGKIVECGSKEDIFQNAAHPYTKALLDAIPKSSPFINKRRIILVGEAPSPINPPSGCRFHPRCPFALPKCVKKEPEITEMANGHFVSCHLFK